MKRVTHTAVQHVVLILRRWAIAWRSHILAGLALLLFLPARVAALTAITDANVGTAATAWVTDPATVTTTFVPIADWDIAAGTRMAGLFATMPTFDANFGAQNVESVTNMRYTPAKCLHTLAKCARKEPATCLQPLQRACKVRATANCQSAKLPLD